MKVRNSVVLKPGDVALGEWRAIYRGAGAMLKESCGPPYSAALEEVETQEYVELTGAMTTYVICMHPLGSSDLPMEYRRSVPAPQA